MASENSVELHHNKDYVFDAKKNHQKQPWQKTTRSALRILCYDLFNSDVKLHHLTSKPSVLHYYSNRNNESNIKHSATENREKIRTLTLCKLSLIFIKKCMLAKFEQQVALRSRHTWDYFDGHWRSAAQVIQERVGVKYDTVFMWIAWINIIFTWIHIIRGS